MEVTASQLQRIAPLSPARFADWVGPLNAAMREFGITTEQRIEMFLAQMMHESSGLSVLVENLNYSADGLANTWPSRYSTGAKAPAQSGGALGAMRWVANPLALKLARNPQAIANNCYANRIGNGSEASGDGWRYRGRGPLMVTGKANYAAVLMALDIDCIEHPELLERPVDASRSAAWFWKEHGLNAIADSGDFNRSTAVINGGDIGGKARIGLWEIAKEVIA